MPRAFIVIGLGYGDEGKGSWVDHLVRQMGIRYVIRFNGGAQALHHVVSSDGITHGFAQFGSGTLVPETFTCLSRFMLIEPEALLTEASALEAKGIREPTSRLIVSENAPIITPFNRLLNRIQEIARGASRHGSCGFGIGVTQADVEELGAEAVYVGDLRDSHLEAKLRRDHTRKCALAREFANEDNRALCDSLEHVDIDFYVKFFRDFYRRVHVATDSEFASIVAANDTIFEGAQGVLLDQTHGFFPYCTRSNTTFENAETLLREAGFDGHLTRVGLLRGYATRHGAGPFITEDRTLHLPACHNRTGDWQGPFRLGWFDAVATRYALEVIGGVDQLAITNLDRLRHLDAVRVAVGYEHAAPEFFHENRILRSAKDIETRTLRTRAMRHITPIYETIVGGDREFDLRYLDALSHATGRAIDAYSTSSGPRKTYLSASPT